MVIKNDPKVKQRTALVVQGSGYRRPDLKDKKATPVRRSDSVGPQRGNVVRRESEAIPVVTAASRCGCASGEDNRKLDPQLLKSQYTQSLEQQLQLLELENNFLKTRKSAADHLNNPAYGHIISRGNEVSLNGRDWCALPSFHPPIEKVLAERIARTSSTRKDSVTSNTAHQSRHESLPRIPTFDRSQKSFDLDRGVDRSSRSIAELLDDKNNRIGVDILAALEESTMKAETLEKSVAAKEKRIEEMEERIATQTGRLRKMEAELANRSDDEMRDKRGLMEESLELQRRLDDLTPTLAEKEGRIARLENERDTLSAKLRSANASLSDMQLKISELSHSEGLRTETEMSVKSEIQRIRGELEETRQKLESTEKREDQLKIELNSVKRQLKEAEYNENKMKHSYEQMKTENGNLHKEISRLENDLKQLEMQRDRERETERNTARTYREDEIAELKLYLKAEKTQVSILEERLKAERIKWEEIQTELAHRESLEDEIKNERARMQKELDALQALSKSLSNENKSLREEKMSLKEKLDEKQAKLISQAMTVERMNEEMEERERHYEEDMRKQLEEARQQNMRTLELEELSRRVRELSESIPGERTTRTSANSSTSRVVSARSSDSRSVEIKRTSERTSAISRIPLIEEEPQCSRRIISMDYANQQELGTSHL